MFTCEGCISLLLLIIMMISKNLIQDERTALHEVARSHSNDDDKLGEIAKLLIDAGCNINAKSSDRGEVSRGRGTFLKGIGDLS